MKRSRLSKSLHNGMLIVAAAMVFSVYINAAEIVGGTTTVALDSGTVTALTGLGFTIAPVLPSTLTGLTATFPITVGDTTTEIDHSGGLTLSKGATTAFITSFVIHLDGPQVNTITGFLSSGAIGIGGVTFFDIGSGLNLTLDSELAGQIAGAFSVPNLTGAAIGTATVDPGLVSSTPEPTSLAFLTVGVLGLVAWLRRRTAKRTTRGY